MYYIIVKERMMSTATTYLKAHYISGGKTILQSLSDRFNYGKNPKKTLDGTLIRAYECDPMTADAEFLLSKAKYKAVTGREQKRRSDVLCYQIRQSFPPGEIDADDALEIGYETAMRWTKGKHAFFVVAHIDRPHPHVHIYYNSTTLDHTHKYRDFLCSARSLRRLSDRVCLEHNLSVIQNPKLHSKGKFLHYGQWLGEARQPSFKEKVRAAIDTVLAQWPANMEDFLSMLESSGIQIVHGRDGVISFRLPGQKRATRWRSSTLGDGYGPEDVQAIIDGKIPARPAPILGSTASRKKINLVIDIQQRMAEGKGPGYEHWAKQYNLKQMAAALIFLRENGLTDYDVLTEKTEAAVDRAHDLSEKLRTVEAQLAATSELMGGVVDYAKTRPVFDGYKAAKYSKKYLAQHEQELTAYRAARAAMNKILNGAKLPKMEELKRSRLELTEKKKALYSEYRQAQKAMRELVAVKTNIDHLREVTGGLDYKEQAR